MTKINRGSSVYFVQDPEEVYTLQVYRLGFEAASQPADGC